MTGASVPDRALSPSATAPVVAALPGNDPSRGDEAPDFYTYLRRFAEMGKAVHNAAENIRAARPEARLRAEIEGALARIDEQAKDVRWSAHWRCGLGQAHKIVSDALASGIETATAGETEGLGPKGESPTAQPGRPNPVAACNSHGELVSALEKSATALEEASKLLFAKGLQGCASIMMGHRDIALAAISKAKGEAL